MKTFNYFYSSAKRFITYVEKEDIDVSSKMLIQVFFGKNDKDVLQEALDSISDIFPNASIISTTTAGEIIAGGLSENSIVVSISVFEKTDVKVLSFENDTPRNIANSISQKMITSKTKLLIIFNNPFDVDGESLIEEIQDINDKVMIAGGNSGDNYKFEKTFTGAGNKLETTGVAVAALDSDSLQVNNGYLLNWNKIGKTMTVTKSDGSTIYEIDHKPAQDVYRYYLGDSVADKLPISGIEFPLIFSDDEIDIARAPIAVGENGSLIMAGHIEENAKIQFSFGNHNDNDAKSRLAINEISKNPVESIFIYSCSARKSFFKNYLNDELNMFEKVAPSTGFITYGEFYHNERNHLLNVSTTFITLSESQSKTNDVNIDSKDLSSDNAIIALHHLIERTAQELEENNYNLTQFKSLIQNSTIYSATDLKGIIIDANDKFSELSGYTKEELIGKSHNIVRHPSVDKEVYADMWKTIKSNNIWKGVIENRAKNGESYFVRSTVMPIIGTSGETLYYVSIRDDITQEVLKERRLEGTADFYESLSKEKEHLLSQYENVIDSNSAFMRVDFDFNITYVNEVFCSIYGLCSDELLKIKHNDLIEHEFLEENKEEILEYISENKKWSGMVKMQRLDKSIIYLDATYTAIYDEDKNVAEYMATYHDITQLIEIQDEIEKTQADVVFTMGSIGETRSKETGNHVKRVAEYSKELALFYGLSKEEANLLKTASPMHDIGKVGIPDSILNKPGKLTDEEFEIMKTHSKLGFNMLRHSKRPILNAAAIIALTHHERWDGKGYPGKIKGEKIPIFGRITAIADVFDALGSDRCYKKAWPDEDIFKLIKDGKGNQFDPILVDVFFENLDIFLEIREKFKD